MAESKIKSEIKALFSKQTVASDMETIPAEGTIILQLPPTIPSGYKLFAFNIRQANAANGWVYHTFCPDENYKLVLFNRYSSSVTQRYAIDYLFIRNNAM